MAIKLRDGRKGKPPDGYKDEKAFSAVTGTAPESVAHDVTPRGVPAWRKALPCKVPGIYFYKRQCSMWKLPFRRLGYGVSTEIKPVLTTPINPGAGCPASTRSSF